MIKALSLLTAALGPLAYAEFVGVPKQQPVAVDKPSDPWHEAAKIAAAVEKRRRKAAKRLKELK